MENSVTAKWPRSKKPQRASWTHFRMMRSSQAVCGQGRSYSSEDSSTHTWSLIRCFNIASQAASASSKVLKGEPVILIAPRPS